MNKRIVYIAGPITTSDQLDNNRAAFELVEWMLEDGYLVINPRRNFESGSGNTTQASQATYMRLNFHQILCSEIIYMLAGWKRSENCKAELAVAKCLGLEIIYAEDAE